MLGMSQYLVLFLPTVGVMNIHISATGGPPTGKSADDIVSKEAAKCFLTLSLPYSLQISGCLSTLIFLFINSCRLRSEGLLSGFPFVACYYAFFIVCVLHEPDYNSRQIRAIFSNDTDRDASLAVGPLECSFRNYALASLRSRGSQDQMIS